MQGNQVIENCQLEWQVNRGVLYVHNKDTGATVLRISGLDTKKDVGALNQGMIDISLRDFTNLGKRISVVSYPRD